MDRPLSSGRHHQGPHRGQHHHHHHHHHDRSRSRSPRRGRDDVGRRRHSDEGVGGRHNDRRGRGGGLRERSRDRDLDNRRSFREEEYDRCGGGMGKGRDRRDFGSSRLGNSNDNGIGGRPRGPFPEENGRGEGRGRRDEYQRQDRERSRDRVVDDFGRGGTNDSRRGGSFGDNDIRRGGDPRDGYYGPDDRRDSRGGNDFRGGGDDRQENGRREQQHGHYGPPPRDGGEGPPPPRGPPPNRQQQQPQYSTSQTPSHLPVKHKYRINPHALPDEKLPEFKDPRGDDPKKRITKNAQKMGSARNTESFDPASTLVRPDLRVWVGSGEKKVFDKPLKHDDVVIVPELFGAEDSWDLYYKLVEEMGALQKENKPGSEWISWHEGAHLICKQPKGSPTFDKVIDRLCEYFKIRKSSIGTRFNWYRDSSDWKPFHHDSAAYNPVRARSQNITVGVSFGARRELAFLRATPLENGEKVKVYFPQTNNGVFSFGRDVNILFKHGVNALPEEEQDGKGRISIILWGLAEGVKEEKGSPPLLGSDGQGPHAQNWHGNRHHHGQGRR